MDQVVLKELLAEVRSRYIDHEVLGKMSDPCEGGPGAILELVPERRVVELLNSTLKIAVLAG